ncbi:MAG: substrate-binding domain-containing protein [Acidobacteriota bacterium]
MKLRGAHSCHSFLRASLLLGLIVLAGCGRKGSSEYTIAVIPKGTTHEFWKSIHAGALKAEEEISKAGTRVSIIWKGPLRENDREQQIQVVEGFLSQGVEGLVLAPLDDKALVRPVEEARRAGIPTVIIDSGLDSAETVSFVATDNFNGGELAAQRLGELLPRGGKVILLRYQEGSASTHNREEGFLSKLRSSFPRLRVLSSDQYAGATRETAKQAAENLLNRFGEDIQGVFCPNESSTAGMLLALEDRGLAGRVVFVGFDAAMALLQALEGGELQGLVVQDPFKMGYLGVKTMVAHLQGRPVERRIDTGVSLLTRDNLEEFKGASRRPQP